MADAITGKAAKGDDTINIGMTFYGGVSLAVYEAGVAEEFLRFVQYCREQGAASVAVKVLSGSSAGGLASIMMAAALVNAPDPAKHVAEMRRIWFDVADLGRLQYQSGANIISFLDNDILENEIKNFLRIPRETRGAARQDNGTLKVLVTGTNMQGFFDAVPVESVFVDPDKFADRAFPTSRHTEVFEFDDSYIRTAAGDAGEKNRARIAKAARVTSSFPAAFPPQFVESPSFPEESRKLYPNQKENPLSFWYYDGGVLDNKPLGHAIDYMESNSDDGEWWYFFVDPDPESDRKKHETWGNDPNDPPDPATSAASVLEMRGAETIYYDLRRIQKINHQVEQIEYLTAHLWSVLCSDKDGAKPQEGLLNRVEQSVKTARLHRFLPDYLKCTAMLRYRFFDSRNTGADPEKRLLLDKIQRSVMNTMAPFDARRIIQECRRQIDKGGLLKREEDRPLIEGLVGAARRVEGSGVMKEYETAVRRTLGAQLRFRQIAYWVEDDYDDGKGRLSEETWKAFIEAWEGKKDGSTEDERTGLEQGLREMQAAYSAVENLLRQDIRNDALFDSIKCYVRLNEAIHASAGVETRGKINVVKIYHNKEAGALAGSKLGHFSGFLDRQWRKNDYLMGMLDAREVLQGKLQTKVPVEWEQYREWRTKQEEGFQEEYRLDIKKDKLDQTALDMGNLPAAAIIFDVNSILSTSEKLIAKYAGRGTFNAFNIAQKLRVNWFSKIVRFFLWTVKQATARPSADGLNKGSRMSQFLSGLKRYFGFTLLGILIGLALSFFLPDAVGPGVRALWAKYQNLSHAGKTGVNVLAALLLAFILRDTLRDIMRFLRKGITGRP